MDSIVKVNHSSRQDCTNEFGEQGSKYVISGSRFISQNLGFVVPWENLRDGSMAASATSADCCFSGVFCASRCVISRWRLSWSFLLERTSQLAATCDETQVEGTSAGRR